MKTSLPLVNNHGFTRTDCLVLAITLLVLLLLGSSAMGNSRWSNETQAARCRMNLKRLQDAFQMYAEDNDGTLVVNEDNSFGGWIQENMSFDGSRVQNRSAEFMMNPETHLLWPYVKDAYVFRCPSDYTQVRFRGKSYQRVRSVSLSGAMGTDRFGIQARGFWLPASAGWQVFSNLAQLEAGSPSLLITFMVEHPDSINDGTYAFQMPGNPSNFPEFNSAQTRWVDFPASFHGGGDSIAFADGSVGTRYWTDPRTIVGPTYGSGIATTPSQANNTDILWLAARMSRPRQN